MTMSDKDRFHLQALMEKDPDAALAFHAERTARPEPIAPIRLNMPVGRPLEHDFGMKKCGHLNPGRELTLPDFGKEYPDENKFLFQFLAPERPADYLILETGVLGAAKDQALACDILRLIKPIFEHMRADGTYAFGPSISVDQGQVSHALGEATDRKVDRVILTRDEEIVPRKPWMNDKEHLMSSICALNGACDSYVGKLHDSITLVRYPRQFAASSLPASMVQMEALVRKSFGAFNDGPLSHTEICNTLSKTITVALSCVIDGDEGNAGRFIDLLELLPYALPFGKRKSEPNSWIVRIGV